MNINTIFENYWNTYETYIYICILSLIISCIAHLINIKIRVKDLKLSEKESQKAKDVTKFYFLSILALVFIVNVILIIAISFNIPHPISSNGIYNNIG